MAFKLCKGRDIHNDLFQEFIIKLLEKDESFLIKKYNEAQFIFYCSNTLKGINSTRWRDTKAINTKNTLVERHNQYEFSDPNVADDDYNYDIDVKFKKTISCLKDIEGYELLLQSIELTTREVSEINNLNQRQLIYQNNKIKDKVKNKVK